MRDQLISFPLDYIPDIVPNKWIILIASCETGTNVLVKFRTGVPQQSVARDSSLPQCCFCYDCVPNGCHVNGSPMTSP